MIYTYTHTSISPIKADLYWETRWAPYSSHAILISLQESASTDWKQPYVQSGRNGGIFPKMPSLFCCIPRPGGDYELPHRKVKDIDKKLDCSVTFPQSSQHKDEALA